MANNLSKIQCNFLYENSNTISNSLFCCFWLVIQIDQEPSETELRLTEDSANSLFKYSKASRHISITLIQDKFAPSNTN